MSITQSASTPDVTSQAVTAPMPIPAGLGQTGPIRRYPTEGGPPRDVTAALGEPLHVHRYQSFAE